MSNSENDDYDDYYEEDYYEGDYAEIDSEDEELREEAYWDNKAYRYKNYVYNWREEQNPCHEAYFNERKIVSQNLLASNLGVIAKQSTNNSYYFAVTNILNTNPVAGAKVTIYNFQQLELASRNTDKEGLTLIDSDKMQHLLSFQKEKTQRTLNFMMATPCLLANLMFLGIAYNAVSKVIFMANAEFGDRETLYI